MLGGEKKPGFNRLVRTFFAEQDRQAACGVWAGFVFIRTQPTWFEKSRVSIFF
jgi:hypothetical protein